MMFKVYFPAVLVSCWLLLLPSSLAQVVKRPQLPFSDPNAFFEAFFGSESASERESVSRVKVSFREEANAGSAALVSFKGQLQQRRIKLVSRGEDFDYLQDLVSELRPLMRNKGRYQKIRVLIADTDDVDARSLPGGTIVVYRGLIDFCVSEAALVGILGHELSHIDRGHQLYHLRRWKLAQQSFTSGFDPSKMMDMGGMLAKMFMRPFRPEEETEADADGARWASELGYDAAEMAYIFQRLEQRDGNKPDFAPAFFRSHPYHDDRYRAILKQSALLKTKHSVNRLYIGKKNLESRKSRRRQEFQDEFTR